MSPEERDHLRTVEVQMLAVIQDCNEMRKEFKEFAARMDTKLGSKQPRCQRRGGLEGPYGSRWCRGC